ncbi:hypothetical protein HRW23_11610 [Streptomyces lunaelactis]|nr:hypothetical protein [Streptomyces lunaelactis]NUL08952.1 hypothetical protein [Streptomyces lunaelactis]NUL22939.1 hypothetical protein [Streptomyces lunaelactis]
MNVDQTPRPCRLDVALERLDATFRGMTAHPDERNCECHWGSAEELALLKVPDVELDPDLLRRTWQASDWDDSPSVMRRILPQFAAALVTGLVDDFDIREAGRAIARGQWHEGPPEEAAAVQEFLHAWWARTLTDPDPAVPAHVVFALCAEATAVLTPWLNTWEATTHTAADQHLAQAVVQWEYDLRGGDQLPWTCWGDEDEEAALRAELTAWLARHAPARLRAHGASEELLHHIRLIGLSDADRWDDPHWNDCTY